MVDFRQLVELDISALEKFAEAWDAIHDKLQKTRDDFHDLVVKPLQDGAWQGDGGEAATNYCVRVQTKLDAVDDEVESLRTFIDKEADGEVGNGGVKGLEGHQKAVLDLQRQAKENGLEVTDSGDVTWPHEAGVSPGYFDMLDEKNDLAKEIEAKIKARLKQATEDDEWLTKSLKVIFGTLDNFETEDRRYDVLEPTWEDQRRRNQMRNVVVLGLAAKGWDHAAFLLQHFLDNSGKTVEAPVDTMLDDVPQFQRDVDSTLDDVRKGPDGPFTTEWSSTAPNLKDKGNGNLDWYYALNHFQYRLVGEKVNGQIEYHVEIQKRYDWGIPSEHRADLAQESMLLDVHYEQADIARLNSVGLARDFDVKGTSKTTTVPA